jgi:heme o synthase
VTRATDKRWWRLARPLLALSVGLTATAGHVLARGAFTAEALVPGAACLLLAAGASAINQAQERDRDARMERTRARPLPARTLAPRAAWLVGATGVAAGLALLLALAGPAATVAGALAVAWYNGLYTWLKTRSPFATVPGALSGSLAPAVGWLAAGGHPRATALWLLMLILFLWQAPHFWLLALRHASDYRRAGFPSPVSALGEPALRRVTFVWILATIAATFLMPLCGMLRRAELFLVLAALAAATALLSLRLLRAEPPGDGWLRRSFVQVNGYVLAAFVLAMLDGGVRP